MAQVAGVKIENDTKGNPRYARIDLRKHGKELEPFLSSIGAINDDDDDDDECISIEEFKTKMINYIRANYDENSKYFTKGRKVL
jgi:hypothetical protein